MRGLEASLSPAHASSREESAPAHDAPRKWRDLLEIDWRPERYEVVWVVLALIYYLLIESTHLPVSSRLAATFVFKLCQVIALVYALSLVVIAGRAAQRAFAHGFSSLADKNIIIGLVQPYFTLNYLMRLIRQGICLFGAIFLFLHLKHLIIWINPRNYDLLFWGLDRKIHFGIQPNVWAMQAFGRNHELAVLLDWLYIEYFTFKLIVTVFFLLEIKGRDLTRRFILAYVLLWMVGGLAYLIAPADGPCYSVLLNSSVPQNARSHVFKFPVVRSLPADYVRTYEEAKIFKAKYYQEQLWQDRRDFLRGDRFPGVFYGVAAMPSLHVSAVLLLSIYLWCASPLVGALGFIYVGIIFFSSFFLQWHYAIDGYIGAFMALAIAFVTLRFPKKVVIPK